jgi:DNA-binding transcriptional LysR family regulator
MLALYDELNVSGAGRRLGMSQPSVSKALRRLRETFDDPLFVRGPKGLVPTPRAHAIAHSARPHLKFLQRDLLKEEPFDSARTTRPISLAISDIAEMAFYPSIIEHFRRHAPKCTITTVAVSDDDLAMGLESGDIDLAAGYLPSLGRRNFRKRSLSQHGFACLMRDGHPLWQPRLSQANYEAAEHIGIRVPGSSMEVLQRYTDRNRFKLNVAVFASHVMSVPFIVMDSDLIATLPYAVVTRFASLTSGVRAALPPFDLPYDLKLHWHRRFDKEPRSVWIREQMAAIFKDHQWLEAPSGPAAFL